MLRTFRTFKVSNVSMQFLLKKLSLRPSHGSRPELCPRADDHFSVPSFGETKMYRIVALFFLGCGLVESSSKGNIFLGEGSTAFQRSSIGPGGFKHISWSCPWTCFLLVSVSHVTFCRFELFAPLLSWGNPRAILSIVCSLNGFSSE